MGPLGRLLYYPEAAVAYNLVFLHKGRYGKGGIQQYEGAVLSREKIPRASVGMASEGAEVLTPIARWQERWKDLLITNQRQVETRANISQQNPKTLALLARPYW